MNVEIGTERLQLRLPPQAAGADPGLVGQCLQCCCTSREQKTSRASSRAVMAAISKSRREFGGQVLQAVYREIDPILGQGFLDLLGEHALGADFGEGDIGDLVAGGLDDLNLNLVPCFASSAVM